MRVVLESLSKTVHRLTPLMENHIKARGAIETLLKDKGFIIAKITDAVFICKRLERCWGDSLW